MIIKPKNLRRTLFLDIETVSKYATLSEESDTMIALWKKKCSQILRKPIDELSDEEASETYINRAGIFAEFAKVACITLGYLAFDDDAPPILKLKTLIGEEKELLIDFCDLLEKHYDDPDKDFLCGHNIKEFDVPFICRRCVVNGVEMPKMLNISGKKPWQVGHLIDTMELWRFGDYKNYTSLSLLAGTLGIPTPKDDIDGSMVGHVYWNEDDMERIVIYCEKDVITVCQVACRLAGMDEIDASDIVYVRPKMK